MKNSFRGYYSKSSPEIKSLWENGIFTFDANVLLNLYRYSQSTSKELLLVFEKLSSKIWITHQTGAEFHRNRLDVIKEQEDSYRKLIESIEKNRDELINQLKSTRHPFVKNAEVVVKNINELFGGIISDLKIQLAEYTVINNEDHILKELTKIFTNKVGGKYSDDNLEKIYREGKIRYDKKIPPGYMDEKTKKDERMFGDLVFWFQIIEYSKEKNKPMILITDEQKEDWWRKHNNKIVGPRPELVEEIYEKAKVEFHMYRVEKFLEYAKKSLNAKIQKKTLDEIEAVRNYTTKLNTTNAALLGQLKDFAGAVNIDNSISKYIANLDKTKIDEIFGMNKTWNSFESAMMNMKDYPIAYFSNNLMKEIEKYQLFNDKFNFSNSIAKHILNNNSQANEKDISKNDNKEEDDKEE